MKYVSTRSTEQHYSDKDVLIKVFSPEGGLWVPAFLPKLRKEFFEDLQKLSFSARLVKMTGLFFPCISSQALLRALEKRLLSVNHAGHLPRLNPLGVYTQGKYVYEAWRGEQASIKEFVQEYAMTCLEIFAQEHLKDEKSLYVLHGEGQTAALAFLSAIQDRNKLLPLAFAPQHSLNRIQKHLLKNIAQAEEHLVFLKASYEQTQEVLKQMLMSEKMQQHLEQQKTLMTSTAAYSFLHVLGYLALMASMYADFFHAETERDQSKQEQALEYSENDIKEQTQDFPAFNLVLLDGDLAEVCAAYYLSQMGVPLKKILVASNKNKTFSDFLRTGEVDSQKKTISTYASMGDLVYALNIERLLFEAYRREVPLIQNFLKSLQEQGKAQLDGDSLKRLQRVFVSGFADNSAIQASLKEIYDRFDYCVDPHTALGMNVYSRYAQRSKDALPTIYLMSYSPYLQPKLVLEALLEKGLSDKLHEDSQCIEALSYETDLPVPMSLSSFIQNYAKKKILREQLQEQNHSELKSDIHLYKDYEQQSLVEESLYHFDLQQLGKNEKGEKQGFDVLQLPLLNKEEFKAYVLERLKEKGED